MNVKKYLVGIIITFVAILAVRPTVLTLAGSSHYLTNNMGLRENTLVQQQQDEEQTILTLTPTNNLILKGLEDAQFSVLDSSTLANRSQVQTNRADDSNEQATTDLTGVTAVFADLSRIRSQALTNNAILESAMQSGVPIVLANVNNARTMGAISGFGLEGQPGDLFVLEATDETTVVIHHVGDAELTMGQEQVQSGTVEDNAFRERLQGLNEADLEAVALELDVTLAELQQYVAGEAPVQRNTLATLAEVMEPPTVTPMTMAEKTAVVQTLITSKTHSQEAIQSATAQSASSASSASDIVGACNLGSCKRWVVTKAGSNFLGGNEVSVEYTVGSNQKPSIDVRFTVALYDSTAPAEDRKYLVVSSSGHISTGGMKHNNSHDRGYYNDRMQVSVEPITAWRTTDFDVHLLKSSPENTNAESTYSVNESVTIGISGSGSGSGASGGANASYSAGWSSTRALSNYRLENLSNSFRGEAGKGQAKWRFKMASSADGIPYNYSWDLVRSDGCFYSLAGISSIGKNNLQPVTLSIWDSPGDYNKWVEYKVQVDHRVKRVKLSTETFICHTYVHRQTYWYNTSSYNTFWVNYDAVNNR